MRKLIASLALIIGLLGAGTNNASAHMYGGGYAVMNTVTGLAMGLMSTMGGGYGYGAYPGPYGGGYGYVNLSAMANNSLMQNYQARVQRALSIAQLRHTAPNFIELGYPPGTLPPGVLPPIPVYPYTSPGYYAPPPVQQGYGY